MTTEETHAFVEWILGSILDEMTRQNSLWGHGAELPHDRWMEIATDEFNDLRWAVRTGREIAGHTIDKERDQLLAVLLRWKIAHGTK